MTEAIKKRLKEHSVITVSGCWQWTRYVTKDGYGRTRFNGVPQTVHRVAYEVFVGEIPSDMEVDHICWNRACCNPEHLRILPALENRRRQRAAMSETCAKGHELTGFNLILRSSGGRQCRECSYAYIKSYNARRKERAA